MLLIIGLVLHVIVVCQIFNLMLAMHHQHNNGGDIVFSSWFGVPTGLLVAWWIYFSQTIS